MKVPRLVICFTGSNVKEVIESLSSGHASWVEVRADLCQGFSITDVKEACSELRSRGARLILTVRHPDEGGKGVSERRAKYFEECIDFVDQVDVELLHHDDLKDVLKLVRGKGKSVIFSYHNFEGTPTLSELEMLFDLAPLTQGDVFKVAAFVTCDEDAMRLVKFTVLHADDNVAVMGMGERARWLRFLLPAVGSKIAYASSGEASAPGQPSVNEYVEIWKRMGVVWE